MFPFFSTVNKWFKNVGKSRNKVSPTASTTATKNNYSRPLSPPPFTTPDLTFNYMQWTITPQAIPIEARYWMELNFMVAEEHFQSRCKCTRTCPLNRRGGGLQHLDFLYGPDTLAVEQWFEYADSLMDHYLNELIEQEQQFDKWLLAEGKELDAKKNCRRVLEVKEREKAPRKVIERKKREPVVKRQRKDEK